MFTLDRPATNGHVSTVILEPARRRPRWLLVLAAVACILAIVASVVVVRSRAGAVTYTTTPVTTGSLAQTVTASGTLNPQNTIDVGTQVSGTISEIDADFNAHVKKGQVLAKLDSTTFQAAVDQAQASLQQAEAQAAASGATASGGPSAVAEAEAQAQSAAASAQAAQANAAASKAAIATAQTGVTKDQAALALAQQTVNRDRQLLSQGYIAQAQMDSDQSNLVAAQSTLASAQAAVQQAQAQDAASVAQIAQAAATQQAQQAATGVSSATAANQAATHDASVAQIAIDRAQLVTAQQNLAHTVITSPVDGTVIARDVSVGQTVAASLQTPTLYAIAQDLTKMELDLAVGEPDIGRVQAGDPVSFTVLAYPNRTFTGTVQQVRKNPTTVSNVVTYDTVVIVDNKDGALMPGMTADATIQVAHVDDATIVPLAAFSYTPPSGALKGARKRNGTTAQSGSAHASAAKTSSAARSAGTQPSGGGSPWGKTTIASSGAVTPGSTGRIFVLQNGKLHPVPVKVGLVGDTTASVTPLRGTLASGAQVVVGDNSSAKGSHAASGGNPLTGGQHGPGGRGGPLGGAR
ncbi:MAG TPA: efflux RND transporter periplasmic adaptor subunit [Candidatus Baltobacteraceae bacterium]|nr:efflux RND transporter periplasmic adaptor subunit [Candidatus Baltobacteraceae bacterium]